MTSLQLAWGLILKDLIYFAATVAFLILMGLGIFLFVVIKKVCNRIKELKSGQKYND